MADAHMVTQRVVVTERGSAWDIHDRSWDAVPTKVARFIVAFDEGKEVAPFAFKAKLIDEVPIIPATAKEKASAHKRTLKQRAKLKTAGPPQQKYGRRSRVAGV